MVTNDELRTMIVEIVRSEIANMAAPAPTIAEFNRPLTIESIITDGINYKLPGFIGGWIDQRKVLNYVELRSSVYPMAPAVDRVLMALGYIPHPGVGNGTGWTSEPVTADDDYPTRLWALRDHPVLRVLDPIGCYREAQKP